MKLWGALVASSIVFATSPASAQDSADMPVVRAQEGDWGMFFRFGGLSTLLAEGNSRNVGGLLLSQVGFKKVLSEESQIPFYMGAGFRLIDPDGPGDNATDVGLDIGGGWEYHFRIWRRISPFVGVTFGIGFTNPTGDDNTTIGLGFGPIAGVEYFVADRVSLTAQYILSVQFEVVPDSFTAVQFSTLAGGAMNLTFYF